MQLSPNKSYKHKEIRAIMHICPMCNLTDEVALWSSIAAANRERCTEGLSCSRCALELVFSFAIDHAGEIIDAYTLDYFKVGFVEFKNNDNQITLYLNNTFVRDIDDNIVDLEKCKHLRLIA